MVLLIHCGVHTQLKINDAIYNLQNLEYTSKYIEIDCSQHTSNSFSIEIINDGCILIGYNFSRSDSFNISGGVEVWHINPGSVKCEGFLNQGNCVVCIYLYATWMKL